MINENKTHCYYCKKELINSYQVRIFDTLNGKVQYVECCREKCANELIKTNSQVWKQKCEDVIRQCVQKLR